VTELDDARRDGGLSDDGDGAVANDALSAVTFAPVSVLVETDGSAGAATDCGVVAVDCGADAAADCGVVAADCGFTTSMNVSALVPNVDEPRPIIAASDDAPEPRLAAAPPMTPVTDDFRGAS
jgi:hypothetical protein